MGKKKFKQNNIPAPVQKDTAASVKEKKPRFFSLFIVQAALLTIIGFICFSNTFHNEYALDDQLVISNNTYVKEGLEGIPKILSSDAFQSLFDQYGSEQGLSGGRYRPLSAITFAIEQEFFASKDIPAPKTDLAEFRHIVNVILYIFSVLVLLYFLRNFLFKNNTIIPFIASLLFLIHPIHTEVVANIKSRDEILSFLFIILTFIYMFRYQATKKTTLLVVGLVFYFLALLSKEYAITLVLFVPMLLYIINRYTIEKSILAALPYFGVALLYVIIRLLITGTGAKVASTEILNNPFLYASTSETWATKIEILNHYLRLLFFPDRLSSDYSYNSIPYTNFTNGWVWVSIFIHLSMIVASVKLFFKRNILSFAIAFYLLNLLLISNLVFDIGATMGERLIYHSSLGFILIIAIGAGWLIEKYKYPAAIGISIAGVGIVAWCVQKDTERNTQWKNSDTLFLADVITVPNSAFTNGNAGSAYNNLSLLPENKDRVKILVDSAITYLHKSVSIHPKYVNGYLQMGLSYSLIKKYDTAMIYLDSAKTIYPNDPDLKAMYANVGAVYNNDGISIVNTKPLEAMELFKKSVLLAPNSVSSWENLAQGYYFFYKDYDKARQAYQKVLEIDPGNKKAIEGLALLPKK